MDYGKSVSSLNSRGLSNARDSLSGTGKASLSLTLSNGSRASIKPYEPTMISFPKEAKYDPGKDNRFTDIVKKYFIETSIHGLKYICENKRHAVERIFWFIAVLTLTFCGGYLIYQVRNQVFFKSQIKILGTNSRTKVYTSPPTSWCHGIQEFAKANSML